MRNLASLTVAAAGLLSATSAVAAPNPLIPKRQAACDPQFIESNGGNFRLTARDPNDAVPIQYLHLFEDPAFSPSQTLVATNSTAEDANIFILDDCLFSQQGDSFVSQRTRPGDVLTFDEAPAECSDALRLVLAGQCNNETDSKQYVTPIPVLSDPELLDPWALCQRPGLPAGLETVEYAYGVDPLPEGCRRVELEIFLG